MKKINMMYILIVLGITCSSVSFAQGTQTGGGRERERGLEHMMLDLVPYLESAEGKQLFPEVQDYNNANPDETFSKLLMNTSIVLVPGEVKDGFDSDRDCVSHFGDPNNRFIECNKSTMLDETKLENQPALYGFLFHEILVQAGIEKSRSSEIPSDYHVSKRMEFHRETIEKWVPGSNRKFTLVNPDRCSIHVDSFRYDQLILRILNKKGYHVVDDREPAALNFYFTPSCYGGCSRSKINNRIHIKNSDFDIYILGINQESNSSIQNIYSDSAESFGGEQYFGPMLRPILLSIQGLIGKGPRGIVRRIPTCLNLYSQKNK